MYQIVCTEVLEKWMMIDFIPNPKNYLKSFIYQFWYAFVEDSRSLNYYP